jgi:hypothetical protein
MVNVSERRSLRAQFNAQGKELRELRSLVRRLIREHERDSEQVTANFNELREHRRFLKAQGKGLIGHKKNSELFREWTHGELSKIASDTIECFCRIQTRVSRLERQKESLVKKLKKCNESLEEKIAVAVTDGVRDAIPEIHNSVLLNIHGNHERANSLAADALSANERQRLRTVEVHCKRLLHMQCDNHQRFTRIVKRMRRNERRV